MYKSAVSETAARLYRESYANFILLSGMYSPNVGRFARENIDNPRYDGDFLTDWEYCAHILLQNGVPEGAVLREDRAMNSMENTAFSASVLEKMHLPIRSAILCRQAFHARRAFMSYSRYFPNIKLMVVPTDTQGISAGTWHTSEKGYRKVMSELIKCGKYFMDFHTK